MFSGKCSSKLILTWDENPSPWANLTTETNCWDVWHGKFCLSLLGISQIHGLSWNFGSLTIRGWWVISLLLSPPFFWSLENTFLIWGLFDQPGSKGMGFLEDSTETQVPKVFTQDGARYLRYVCSFQKKMRMINMSPENGPCQKENCLLTTIFSGD